VAGFKNGRSRAIIERSEITFFVIPFPKTVGAVMADNPQPRAPLDPGKEIAVTDIARAPIIYFEGVPTLGFNNGVVNLMLAVGLVLPTADGGTLTKPVAVAHLRCHTVAARHLRDAIDKALLLATPVPEGKAN
jgi:hypothetical protein